MQLKRFAWAQGAEMYFAALPQTRRITMGNFMAESFCPPSSKFGMVSGGNYVFFLSVVHFVCEEPMFWVAKCRSQALVCRHLNSMCFCPRKAPTWLILMLTVTAAEHRRTQPLWLSDSSLVKAFGRIGALPRRIPCRRIV